MTLPNGRPGWHLLAPLAFAAVVAVAGVLLFGPGRLVATHGNTLTANPTSGPPGASVKLSGTNWTLSNSPYRVFWDAKGGTQLGTFAPASNGSWNLNVTVPGNASLGAHEFVACEGYLTEFQDCVSAGFTVIAPPTPTSGGPPTPTRTPTPPNTFPDVSIIEPGNGETITSRTVEAQISVTEDQDLETVTAVVIHSASTDQAGAYDFCGTEFSLDRFCPSGPPFPIVYNRTSFGGISLDLPPTPLHPEGLKDGTYQLRVTACDAKDQCDTAVRNFELDLPDPTPTATPFPSDRHRLLIMRVDFADATGVAFTASEFETGWVDNLEAYFTKVSNNRLALETYVVDEVIRIQQRRFYHRCAPLRDMNGDGMSDNADIKMWLQPGESCRYFAEDALRSAISRGLVDTVTTTYVVPPGGGFADAFDSVLVIIGSPNPYSEAWEDTTGRSYRDFWGNCGAGIRDWSNSSAGTPAGSTRSFTTSDGATMWAAISPEDPDCDGVAEASDIDGATHEVGHMISRNAAHPADYNNNHDLMDACYPCFPSSYTRTRSTWFPSWLPPARIVKTNPPNDTTVILAPAELPSGGTPSPQAIRVNTGVAGVYYMVECRRSISWDGPTLGNIPSEGVLILQVMEGNSPETAVMPPGSNIAVLWTDGQTFTDTANDIEIRVGPDVGDGCTVTVDYGGASGATAPDLHVNPWLSPPLFAYETVDIWLDSSCNGFGFYRYGQWPDGTIVASGDTPCANHANSIKVRIRNVGTATATNIRGRIEVQTRDISRPGLCTPYGWTEVAAIGPIGSLSPGATVEVMRNWVPVVPAGTSPYITRTTCIRVILDPVAGELVTGNQDGIAEQEAIVWFEADAGTAGGTRGEDAGLIEEKLFLVNDSGATREYVLDVSGVPEGWTVDIGDGGSASYLLNPGEEVSIPVRIDVPPGTPPGETAFVNVDVSSLGEILSPSGQPVHLTQEHLGGITLVVQATTESSLSLDATAQGASIDARGQLQPGLADTAVAIDYTGPGGETETHVVMTDSNGQFADALSATLAGQWTVRAFWQGDLEHSGAVSNEANVVVAGGLPTPTPVPPEGDANCNGAVNAIDAALILQFVAGLIPSLLCPEQADVNDDGQATAIDAALILQFEAGLIHLEGAVATKRVLTRLW